RLDGDHSDLLVEQGGPLVQGQGIRTPECSVPPESVPEGAVQRRRETPPLYGLGLVDAIPAAAIAAHADPDDRDGDGISGKLNVATIPGGGMGRFGWKAEMPTLGDFVAKSLVEEIGITSPARPREERREGKETPCDRVTDPEDDGRHVAELVGFIRLLPPLPGRAVPAQQAARGQAVFRDIGCAGCHVEKFETGPSDVAALDRKPVRAYSDFLLHDMGDRLADGIVVGEASGREFRTAPLWGAAHSAPYLHDGRAPTLESAIGLHAGEAAAARDRFVGLATPDREALVAFLDSL